MSLEKLIGSALRDGAGTSLRKVRKSESYGQKLARKRELTAEFGPRSHRGIAHRLGPLLFGSDLNLFGEAEALRAMRPHSKDGKVSDQTLVREVLIEELGERLIDAATAHISDGTREMAEAYGEAKTAEAQISLLEGLKAVIYHRSLVNQREPEGPKLTIPPGYGWVEYAFEDTDPCRFLPKKFRRLGSSKGPNCLGMSILLAAWAKLAGVRALFCTEITNNKEEDYRFQSEVCEVTLNTLRSLSGRTAADERRALRQDLKSLKGWQMEVRDWHHGIAIELVDGQWFYLDPYANLARVFPSDWHIPGIAKLLRKYEEVLPGLSLVGEDKGVQEGDLDLYLKKFLTSIAMAEAARYKLAKDPGDDLLAGDLLAIAPELVYLCDLLVDNNRWPRPAIKPERLLAWLQFTWEKIDGLRLSRSREAVMVDIERFKRDARFRRRNLDDLIVRFCEEALVDIRKRGLMIHPALEFGNMAPSIGLTVLSNLSSWTEDKVPGTLLLEYGNSQMLWHEAASPLPQFESLSQREEAVLRYGGRVVAYLPQHKKVRLKLQAMQEFLETHPKPQKE